ncbi:uncharacterized protein C11orf97 homolog isoform X4 [Phyllobates terribilis]|uniref:uncharacterized protein C11orf97 homolog isoform X4 n=1 Tax=Phyllobates terribilis TaxID=111132 RepID=UPI003CCB721E
MKRQPRSRIHGGDVGLWNVTSDEEVDDGCQEHELISSMGDPTVRKHFFYVGTPKRVQQLTQEERFFEKEEIKVPSVYPSVSNSSTMHKITDGASSKKWLPKPLTSQPKPYLSRDAEDVPPP